MRILVKFKNFLNKRKMCQFVEIYKKSKLETIIAKIIAKIWKSANPSETAANEPIPKEIQKNPDLQRLKRKFGQIHEYFLNGLILRNVCQLVEK